MKLCPTLHQNLKRRMSRDGSQIGVASCFAEGPAPELVDSAFSMEVNDGALLYSGMSLADLAHAVMLIEIGIVPQESRVELLNALIEMHNLSAEEIDFDNALVDVYTNRDHMLHQRTPDTAGWIQAGRPRREVSTLAYLIVTRAELLEVVKAVSVLMDTLLDFSEEHQSTLLPDYTYLQRAHPTTLAHYVLTFVQPMGRDLDRLQSAYNRTNKSPAGAGSTNGSRLPIDRDRLAELLGFNGLVLHTRDAMWQSDGPIELMSAALAVLCNVDHLTEDLQIWATSEFNFVELSDSHSRSSVIMPQKKNPYSLTFVRGVAREMIGRLAGTAALQSTPSGQVDNRIFTYSMVPKGLMQTKLALKLLSATVSGLTVNKDEMSLATVKSLGGSTDLAEEIMTKYGIDAKTANSIVGRAVRSATQMGKELEADLLNSAAKDIINRSLNMSDDIIEKIMDPKAIVATRTGPGGSSSKSVQEMITTFRDLVYECNQWGRSEESRLKEAEKKLFEKVTALCQCT